MIKKITYGLLLLFLLIQFIRPAKNKNSSPSNTGIDNLYSIPNAVQTLLKAACYDCHSNNTVYPWYAEIQPMGWSMNKHIIHGKKELNFDEFGTYSKMKRRSKLKSMASQITDGKMPLPSYQWLHPDANLSSAEKEMLLEWTAATIEFIEMNK